MPTFTYNGVDSVVIKNAIILNIIHNIFNLREAEVIICLILILLKRADVLGHYINSDILSTLSQNLIVNIIFRQMHTTDRILFNKMLISSLNILKDKM
jgi:hypothetical protein